MIIKLSYEPEGAWTHFCAHDSIIAFYSSVLESSRHEAQPLMSSPVAISTVWSTILFTRLNISASSVVVSSTSCSIWAEDFIRHQCRSSTSKYFRIISRRKSWHCLASTRSVICSSSGALESARSKCER